MKARGILIIVLGIMLLLTAGVISAQGGGDEEQVINGPWATLPSVPPVPEGNPLTPEKIELGRMLFFEPRLFPTQAVSCYSCHNLSLGGTNPLPTSLDHALQPGNRNAPTVLNAAFFNQQFWDGRAASVEEQVEIMIEAGGVELTVPSQLAVEAIQAIEGYRPYFAAAFPDDEEPVTFANIVAALASFERTLTTPNDPLDRYLRGDEAALSPEALGGMETFQASGCIACHNGPVLSLGITVRFAHGDSAGEEPGDNLYRIPTLRNIPLTGPYFHDGSAATLAEAAQAMATVQVGPPLTDEQLESILAFLNALIGEQPEIVVPVLPH